MAEWIIYFNSKCGSCRDTLKLLKSKGIKPRVVEYLKNPPSLNDLNSLLNSLRISPLDMIRAKEPVFEKLKLNEPGKSRKDLLRAVCENPVLLQRPIVIRPDGRGIIARPPEKVLELL